MEVAEFIAEIGFFLTMMDSRTRGMSAEDLTPEDYARIAALLKKAIGDSKFPFSDENRELRAILDKLAPPAPKPATRSLPAAGSVVLNSRKRARRGR